MTVLLLSIAINHTLKNKHQQQLIVYDIPKISVIQVAEGNSGIMIADRLLTDTSALVKFNILPYWGVCGFTKDGIKIVERNNQKLSINTMWYQNNTIRFRDKTILIVSDTNIVNRGEWFPVGIDYLILSGNVKVMLTELIKKFRFKNLVIDSSNSYYQSVCWRKEANLLGIGCYSVPESGAFVAQFR
jgi:competence protein ComEC